MEYVRAFVAAGVVGLALPGAAWAGLRICNETGDTQSVAIGYKGAEDWTSEGWWNIAPGDCATPVLGDLQKRYFYYRAEVDGGDFDGENYMFCTSPDEFTIVGDTECEDRGYDREAFREIDTGEEATEYVFTLVADTAGPKDAPETRAEPEPDPVAEADEGLRICNDTALTQSVSVGYKGAEDWTSEGWWNIAPGDCATLLAGALQQRYYYYRAEVDGGDFDGENYMFCTSPEEYTIVGDVDCAERGYDREDFSQIDTGETARGFTFRLAASDAAPDAAAQGDTGASDTGETDTARDDTGLDICNKTDHVQSVSIAYKAAGEWVSEGWWNIPPGECKTPVGELASRYYYYRAEVDGGDFDGQGYTFCTTPEEYTITGNRDCAARGYDAEEFAEIDVGDYTKFIFTLVPPEDLAAPPEAPAEVGAGLEICNDTAALQAVAIGYKGDEDWISEGWWQIEPAGCVRPTLDGVNRRYLYYRAEVANGGFEGQNYFFCTTPDPFTIVGDGDCAARGYDREDFREIDTGTTEAMFTFTLVSPDPVAEPMTAPEPEVVPQPVPEAAPQGDAPALGGFDVPAADPAGTEPEMDAVPEAEPGLDIPAFEPEPEPASPRRGGSRG